MKTNVQMKRTYQTPRVFTMTCVEHGVLLDASPGGGITTPGEDMGEDGGGLAKKNDFIDWEEDCSSSDNDRIGGE